MALSRSYTAGRYAMDLDGDFAGWIKSVEGGHAKAEVIVEKIATDIFARKHIAGVKYEDISVQIGTAMSNSFFQWIDNSIMHKSQRISNGSIISADFDTNEVSRLNFFNALITEVGLPACDASSKDAATMTVKFAPEYTRNKTGSGAKISGPTGNGQQKLWTPSNFRFRVDGFDDACKWVSKVEALTIKQKVVENPLGEIRDFQKECAYIEIPNVVFTIAESHADLFYKWHEDFVINGNCSQDKEKSGSLEFLTSNLKDTVLTVNFKQMGIFALTPDKSESSSENIKKVKVEMYCEMMEVKPGQNAIFS